MATTVSRSPSDAKFLDEHGSSDLSGEFRRNERSLVRYITMHTGCRATAEDLVQDAFIRAGTASTPDVRNPRAFLFRIALNLLTNYKVQRRRRRALTDQIRTLLWDGVDEATPERHVSARQELSQVYRVMDDLPERTRNVLFWSRFEGLNQAQIAARLGISYQAVEKHLQKAITRLTEARQQEKS